MAHSSPVDFERFLKISFKTVIIGHHIYKATWNPTRGKRFVVVKDTRVKAIEYDEHVVGVYKHQGGIYKMVLVRHIPIERRRGLKTHNY